MKQVRLQIEVLRVGQAGVIDAILDCKCTPR